MRKIARKKKPTRKYIPKNEFRMNYSPQAKGHPHFIFGRKGDKYKSLGLTTEPKDDIRHIRLSKNPNPNDSRPSYLQLTKPHTASISYYGKDVLEGWAFGSEDMPVVRHRIKKYKKSMNRKPPMWYEKKKKFKFKK